MNVYKELEREFLNSEWYEDWKKNTEKPREVLELDPQDWIPLVFVWRKTKQGEEYWRNVTASWARQMDYILNKI